MRVLRPPRCMRRLTLVMLPAAAVALGLLVGSPRAQTPAPASTLPSKQVLERQKLKEEIEQLQHSNDAAGSVGDFFSRYGAFITALVAAGGLLLTIWKQGSDQRTQRNRDRTQSKTESDRRLEDRFATILTELGSTSVAVQAGAASSLVTYLGHESFHHPVRIAVLSNLKIDHEEPIRKLLGRVYKNALSSGDAADSFERDLSRAKLANIDLSSLELRESDLAFADLTAATLVGCDLFRARGYQVVLEGARVCSDGAAITSLIEVRFQEAKCRDADFSGTHMINAHFKGADVRYARFLRARMQSAHFEGAKLSGARFQDANLDDAYFYSAELDDVALSSIVRARNWRSAHWDDDIGRELKKRAARIQ